MRFSVDTYIPGDSPLHKADARVKIALLLAYSLTLFFVQTWVGLGICVGAFAVALAMSRIAPGRVFLLAMPVYVLVGFAVLFNAFSFDAETAASVVPGGTGAVSAGVFADAPPAILAGSFGFLPAGFVRGCFYAVRIAVLVWASFIVCFTTTSTAMVSALSSFLAPLRRLRVPVDDVAAVFSIALRFIPLTAEELFRIRDAQAARGASFGSGSLRQRIRAWQTVFVPLLVGLFRRADRLATAMDARCYGVRTLDGSSVVRTSLAATALTAPNVAALLVGLAACAAVAFLF